MRGDDPAGPTEPRGRPGARRPPPPGLRRLAGTPGPGRLSPGRLRLDPAPDHPRPADRRGTADRRPRRSRRGAGRDRPRGPAGGPRGAARARSAAHGPAAPARAPDEHRHRPLPPRRAHPLPPGPRDGRGAAGLRGPLDQGAHPAAPRLHRRHPCAGEPARPHRGRRRAPAPCRPPRVRLPRGRGVGDAHRLLRQPPPPRRAHQLRPAPARRRGAAAARRGRPRAGRDVREPVAVRLRRRRPRPGRRPLPPSPALAPPSRRHPPPRHPERVGGGLLRPRPGAAHRPRRPRRRARGRALRAGRRMVRLPPGRHLRSRRLGRLAGGVAGRARPAGRPRARPGHGVRALVRTGDGQRGLRRRPRPSRVDHGPPHPSGCRCARGTSRC